MIMLAEMENSKQSQSATPCNQIKLVLAIKRDQQDERVSSIFVKVTVHRISLMYP